MKLKTRSKLWVKSKVSHVLRHYLGTRCRGILYESENGLLLLPASDLSISRTISKTGVYNSDMLAALKNILQADSRALFVGTHVGTVLIPASRWCQSVTGIEANPETFFLLQKNLALNNVTNATLHNVAAYDSDREIQFVASRENTGGSKIFDGIVQRFEFFYDNPDIIRVPARSLDQLLSGQRFDVVVMDIEGGEYRALQGMTALLSQVRTLILEILPNHLENVAKVSPDAFFSAIPGRFSTARPLDAPDLSSLYTRENFIRMYDQILANRRFGGADVVFQALDNPHLPICINISASRHYTNTDSR